MDNSEAAGLFRSIADRLETNASVEFGGAFLVIPPTNGGDPIDGITVTSTPNPVVFWSSLEGQIELAINTYKSAQQSKGRNGW